MKHAATPLFLLVLLAGIILVSGCTSLDPQAIATSNSMIKQFLNEHPNAKIVVTHFTANQSKYMIDQIRKDCDNPYLDEKEFYRVNITDPDTNFYAIVWIDWETKTVECVFKIGTEGKTVEKPNTGNCTNHAYSKCYNSHVYWFDSCGNVQEKKEYCKQGCSETACLGDCKSKAEYRCYGDHVYWFDSCGNVQEKKEYCNYGCENGFCKTQRLETCEQAGGYCIWPQGYCGDGICSESERQQICEQACPSCSSDTASSCQAANCTKVCKYICLQDCGTIPSSGSVSDGQTTCENKCANPNIKFADSWTDKETYSIGEAVKFYAKLADTSGNPATPEQGNRVYLFAISPKTGLSTSSTSISYNYSSGYYGFSTSPIPSNIDSGTWGFYATAQNNESFAAGEIVYVAINSAASPASLPAIPAQYEGCANQCLLISRIAQPSIAQSSASAVGGGQSPATGMVVAMEVTATSTVVSYQCRDGYAIGNYFCKEGGICCAPQTTPTEFCGSSTQGPCSSDSECATTGCSGQVCQSIKEDKAATTCEYKDCYNAQKYGMQCKCVGAETASATAAMIQASLEGRCMWTKANGVCTDSDGGKNYYQQGTATANGQSLTDHCNADGTLTEKYCSGGQISAEVYKCPYGCNEGACIKQAACSSEGLFCGGIAGIHCCSNLTCQLDGTYPDAGGKCVKTCTKEGEQFSTVYKENYPEHCCSGLTEWNSGMDTSRVENGTCVQHPELVAGSPVGTCIKCGDGVCGKSETICNCPQDCKVCSSDSDCMEIVCPGVGFVHEVCENGKCVLKTTCPTVTCTDSDGGKNPYVTGYAKTLSQGTTLHISSDSCELKENDIFTSGLNSCSGTNCYVKEGYCTGNIDQYDNILCQYGCSNGTCIQ